MYLIVTELMLIRVAYELGKNILIFLLAMRAPQDEIMIFWVEKVMARLTVQKLIFYRNIILYLLYTSYAQSS